MAVNDPRKASFATAAMVSIEYLKECFDYDRDTGKFTWKERPLSHFNGNDAARRTSNTKYAGTPAGCDDSKGHIVMSFRHKGIRHFIYAHHVVWLFEGRTLDPDKDLDHIDRNGSNNHISNLREATHIQNMHNKHSRKINPAASGHSGVYYDKRPNAAKNPWFASICVDYKIIRLGAFNTMEKAAVARREAEARYYGEFAPNREPLPKPYCSYLTQGCTLLPA